MGAPSRSSAHASARTWWWCGDPTGEWMRRSPRTAHRGSTTGEEGGPGRALTGGWADQGTAVRARSSAWWAEQGRPRPCVLVAQLAGWWVEQERADRVRSPAGGAGGGGRALAGGRNSGSHRRSFEHREIQAERVGHGKNGSEKSNVRKEIRFRGGARSLFFYHARPERRTSVCSKIAVHQYKISSKIKVSYQYIRVQNAY
jgi:hypothetical protein